MDSATRSAKLAELDALRARVALLEEELDSSDGVASQPWRQSGYLSYYATAGFFLGIAGALTSLLFNVFGAIIKGLPPLKLIQVYLTFGMGEKALELDTSNNAALAMAIGCCLYIGTGMLLGIPFHLALMKFAPNGPLGRRMAVASFLAIVIWLVNYYAVLSWLQPLLFGDAWIVKEVPPVVAALTHLVFGWTQALVYPIGVFEPRTPAGVDSSTSSKH